MSEHQAKVSEKVSRKIFRIGKKIALTPCRINAKLARIKLANMI
jgi:hypothetical protein